MRRAGHNPTDVEVTDIINKIDSDSGNIDFQVRLPAQGLTSPKHELTLAGILLRHAGEIQKLRHGVRLQGDLQGVQQG